MSEGNLTQKKCSPRLILWILLVVFVLLGLLVFGTSVQLEIPFQLLTGWVTFLLRNIKMLEVNLEITVCGIVALIMAVFGLHRFLLWLRKNKPWKWAWTISITVLMLMLFAASIATTGIIHQIGWMTREPLTQSSLHRLTGLVRNTSNAKQIFFLMIEYDGDHGEMPESLESVQDEGYTQYLAELQFYPENGKTLEPWIYLGSGRLWNAGDVEGKTEAYPILISPRPIQGKWVVLRMDGSVESMVTNQLVREYPKLLERLPNLISR